MPRTRLSPLCLQRLADQFGIRGDEIGRCDRAGDLPDIEGGLVARRLVEPVGLADHTVRPIDRDSIGLTQKVKDRVELPFGIGEALVGRIVGHHRRRRLARQAPQRVRP